MFKKTVRMTACLALAMLASHPAMADKFPSQPIKIVLGFGVGGGADAVARLYAHKLGQVLNASVIVENKPGAYEQIAGQAVANAKPDGYTLWLATTGGVVQAPLLKKLPYDPQKNLTHIGVIAEADAVLAVKNGFPARNVDELLQYARKNPGVINFGSAGRGSQYVSIRYSERLAEAGIAPSVGSKGDSYDNALAETINGLYKAELIHRRAPWKTREAVELATLEWVSWFNHHRLLEPIGYLPPAEAEAHYYRQLANQATTVAA